MGNGQHANASGDSGGYVHDPEAFRERTDVGTEDDSDGDVTGTDDANEGSRDRVPRNDPSPNRADLTVPERETFGLRGWVLVGVLVLSFLVVPAVIVFVPPAALPFEVAFLILPLLPALLLGAIAVWSALAGA